MSGGFQAYGSGEGFVGGFGSGGPAGPILPDVLYLMGGLVGRWRADLLVTGTSTVDSWGDLSGVADSNRDATASGADRPALVVADAGLNGQPSIAFTGAQAMKTGTWSVAQVQPITVALIGYNTVTSGTNAAYDGLSNLSFAMLIDAALGTFIAAPSTLGAGSYHTTKALLLAEFNGASSKFFENDHVATATGNAGPNGFAGMTIGNRALAQTDHWTIAEIAVWNKVLSAQNKTDLAAYVLARYGITVA